MKRARYAGYRGLFKKLLYFKHFIALEQPLIVCEGKTDNIYLISALKALDPKYPQLAKVDKGVLTTEVKFLKHSKVEHDVLELSGGSGNLAKLIARYKKEVPAIRTVRSNTLSWLLSTMTVVLIPYSQQ